MMRVTKLLKSAMSITALCGIAIWIWGCAVPSGTPGAVVRERATVYVDGVAEEWRLEWRTPPQPACTPEGDDWYTCPCSGFAFGEEGELDLVRACPGRSEERLPLTPFFVEYRGDSAQAILPRWPVYESDLDAKDSSTFAETIRQRPVVTIMKLSDYNHDGLAAEFPLQIGAVSCGHRQTVVVGITRANPRLHVFGTVARADKPLVLERFEQWEAFRRSSGDTTLTMWPCGDHGTEQEEVMELHATPAGVRAIRILHKCNGTSSSGIELSREEL